MSRADYPEDRARAQQTHFQNQLKGMTMRDPHWKTDHPTAGASGVRYIWRFSDTSGFVAQTKIGAGGWEMFPVKFLGPEINNFVAIGDTRTGLTPDQVEATLVAAETPPVVEVEATLVAAETPPVVEVVKEADPLQPAASNE